MINWSQYDRIDPKEMQALKEEVERLQGQAKTLQEDKMKAVQEVEAKQKMVCIKP